MIALVNGMKIYYEAAGDGRPVVLLHGWGADAGGMRVLLNMVREQVGGRAWALDFPGFGYSDPPGQAWGVGDYTRLLEAFMDGQGISKADLVGHSFGGRVAICLAAENPQRVNRLVLVDSAGILPRRGVSYYLRVGVAKVVKRAAAGAPGPARLLGLDKVVARQGSADYRAARGVMRETFVRVVNEDLSGLLPRLTCPTLLVWGEKDDSTPLADGERMRKLIRGSRLELIAGAGHFSYAEEPAEFARRVVPFLREGQV